MFKLWKTKTPRKAAGDMDKNAGELKTELENLLKYGEILNELQHKEITPPVIDEMLVYFRLTRETYRRISELSKEIGDDIQVMIKDLEEM